MGSPTGSQGSPIVRGVIEHLKVRTVEGATYGTLIQRISPSEETALQAWAHPLGWVRVMIDRRQTIGNDNSTRSGTALPTPSKKVGCCHHAHRVR
jgi:hypothetical protein